MIKVLLRTVLCDFTSFFPTLCQPALDYEIITIQHSACYRGPHGDFSNLLIYVDKAQLCNVDISHLPPLNYLKILFYT